MLFTATEYDERLDVLDVNRRQEARLERAKEYALELAAAFEDWYFHQPRPESDWRDSDVEFAEFWNAICSSEYAFHMQPKTAQ